MRPDPARCQAIVAAAAAARPRSVRVKRCTHRQGFVLDMAPFGLGSRWETDAFLKQAGAHLHYSAEDFAQDLRSLRELGLR